MPVASGDVRDQTQMYRCTVSHESEPLAQLVRCFERRGIFDCDAQRLGEKDGLQMGGFSNADVGMFMNQRNK